MCSWIPVGGVAHRQHCPAFTKGRPPRNKGLQYPADPPTVEEIIAAMHAAGDDADAVRLRGLIVVLWRAGLRISEALALTESDLDPNRGAILVRRGKGGKRREVGMDRWAWEQWSPGCSGAPHSRSVRCSAYYEAHSLGRAWASAGVRSQLHHAATRAGVRRRFAPHQLRHAHAVEMSREGVPLLVIQRQLGHADFGDHVGIPARDRQHRDRSRGPPAPGADDPDHPRPLTPSGPGPVGHASRDPPPGSSRGAGELTRPMSASPIRSSAVWLRRMRKRSPVLGVVLSIGEPCLRPRWSSLRKNPRPSQRQLRPTARFCGGCRLALPRHRRADWPTPSRPCTTSRQTSPSP
jgi:Phage integrase family